MSEPFRLTTADPRFDPHAPLTVNGFLFLPAEAETVASDGKPLKVVSIGRRKRVLVEHRRKIVERTHG